MYGVSDAQYKEHMEHVIETLDIGPLLDKPVRKLSLGQRMRCELAAALIHNPPLLFLDEPTIGLDVLVKLKIREFLKEMNERYKTTILLTTHDITDIEALCERVIMLDEGNIMYDGSLNNLRTQWGAEKEIHFQFIAPVSYQDLSMVMPDSHVVWSKAKEENTWVAKIPNEEVIISMLISKVVQAFQIKDLKINEVSTEEIIRNIYEEGIKHG